MQKYEIYRIEGGYRVAAQIFCDRAVVRSSPFFRNRGLAAAWRNRAVAKDPKYAHNGRYVAYNYPCSLEEERLFRDLREKTMGGVSALFSAANDRGAL